MKWAHIFKLLKLKKKTGDLVVTRRVPPVVKLAVFGLLAVALIAGGWTIYNHGLKMAGFESLQAARHVDELRNEIKLLKSENADLRETLVRAQRSLQMNQVAYQELERSLSDSAANIVKLREELSFYKTILSPESKITGLQIHSLKVERTGQENEYHYKIVLVQSLKHEQSISGNLQLEVLGTEDGTPSTLIFPPKPAAPIKVNFKYFQDVEGVLKLPKSFKPQRIKASITTAGANPYTVEQSYYWPKL